MWHFTYSILLLFFANFIIHDVDRLYGHDASRLLDDVTSLTRHDLKNIYIIIDEN